MTPERSPVPHPLPFAHPTRRRWPWLAFGVGATAIGIAGWALCRGRGEEARGASTVAMSSARRAAAAPDVTETAAAPDVTETEQVHANDVTPLEPVVRDAEVADHNETDNDLAFEESLGDPVANHLIGIGGSAGGVLRGPVCFECEPVGETAEPRLGTESYADAGEGGFVRVAARPLSTFSIDVDSASYANVRRMLSDGHLPPKGAVRVEELVNYFRYADAPPTDGRPFAVHGEVASCPWNAKHRLVRIALKAREIQRKARPASNLVFLLDVSGSMDAPNKLPLVKASMRMLLDELNDRDTVSIVVYAGASGLALAPTSCERKREIADAIDRLSAGGSTNGASGLTLAYETAALHFVLGGVNRVVLCTDGDWNVGVTSREDLWRMIAEKAKSGVFLSVLGFGMGNYKDDMLEQLADRGNGNHGYVDSTREAHRLLVDDAGGTLVTVAKDVKLQVEWNPTTVAGYRLVGYENRRLADRDFKDDAKDAGEMGAGHTVTALYEVVPAGQEVAEDATKAEVDPLKYQRAAPGAVPTDSAEMLTVRVRYKEPDSSSSVGFEAALTDGGAALATASADLRFAAAVAEFALLLRRSPQKGDATFESVLVLARDSLGADAGGWRHEFLDLVARARMITGS